LVTGCFLAASALAGFSGNYPFADKSGAAMAVFG
jgi:hypothetical protein